MSGTTSVPIIALTPTGFIAPTQAAVLAGVQTDTNAAFGGGLNPALNTPQGQLSSSTAAIVYDCYAQEALLFNSVDPAFATGRMQDAIGRIYFQPRIAAVSTVVQVACVGGVGVVIPIGAGVTDAAGNLYFNTTAGVIPVGGTITLPFAAAAPGPLAVPASVTIYQAIPGWNTASVASGVVGAAVEGRAAYELRRAASVAKNATGFYAAIYGNVLAVPGVIDAYVDENNTGSPVLKQGVTLAANSLYVCVSGGVSSAIALAIWQKKNPGCAYTGGTTVVITDANPGFGPGPPTYSVTYQTAIGIQISFSVVIKNSVTVPSNALTLISAAINNAFLGLDGGMRARIGSTLFASRYYSAVALLGSWAQIIDIQIGANSPPEVAFTGSIAATTLTVTAVVAATFTGTGSGVNLTASAVTGTIYPGYILSGTGVPVGTLIVSQTSGTTGGAGVYVTSASTTSAAAALTAAGLLQVGEFVYGVGVLPGTLITALGTGTGGTGTYTVAVNQTIASEAMAAVLPTANTFVMNINQVPTFALADVNLVLV